MPAPSPPVSAEDLRALSLSIDALSARLDALERSVGEPADTKAIIKAVGAAYGLDQFNPRHTAKALAELMRDQRAEVEARIDSVTGAAAADAAIGRSLAAANAESALNVLCQSAAAIALGDERTPGSVKAITKRAEDRAARIFKSIDSARDKIRLRIQPALPDDASPGEIAERMLKGTPPDVVLEAETLEYNAGRRLRHEVEYDLRQATENIRKLHSIVRYVKGEGDLDSSLDPALRMSAESVRISKTAGLDISLRLEQMSAQLKGAEEEVNAFAKKMLPMWESAISTAIAKAQCKLYEAAGLEDLAMQTRDVVRERTQHHRKEFPRK